MVSLCGRKWGRCSTFRFSYIPTHTIISSVLSSRTWRCINSYLLLRRVGFEDLALVQHVGVATHLHLLLQQNLPKFLEYTSRFVILMEENRRTPRTVRDNKRIKLKEVCHQSPQPWIFCYTWTSLLREIPPITTAVFSSLKTARGKQTNKWGVILIPEHASLFWTAWRS